MSTGTFIVQSALKRIGAHSIVQPAAPETITEGFNILNSMLMAWLTDDIDIGIIPLKVVGNEIGEPNDTTNGIINNLAIELSPDFDNGKIIVSQDLRMLAFKQFTLIKDVYQVVEVPLKIVSSTLPLGQGNRTGFSRQRVFKGIGGTVNG